MADTHAFSGRIFDDAALQLGEGPTFDPVTGTAWWFNIVERQLHELHLASGRKTVHALPFMGSVFARIDYNRQLLATDEGLFIRNASTGELSLHVAFEPGKPGNRSNDGRVHKSGALWIGTMGRSAETGAGAIYHVAKGKVTTLFEQISISNSICFSPDGAIAYYTDTAINRLMRVALDPATGLPTGKPEVLVDNAGQAGGMDGSVCDADGMIWNARWGQGAVDCYAPDGQHIDRYLVPASQTSCPAFIGPKADRMIVTTAWQGMDDADRASGGPQGATFELGITVKGVFDAAYRAG
jgi:sugar lactone lactonase YvrE